MSEAANRSDYIHRSLHYSHELIARQSVTPEDNGCQRFLSQYLSSAGFSCKHYQVNGVSNLIARWGSGPSHFAFCGHTDVVSPGPLEEWHTDPFTPVFRDNMLFGHGAADMKSGIAAMLAATERSVHLINPLEYSFWWLITSDEEGEALYGTSWMKKELDKQGIKLSACLIGEPTASQSSGDMIKVGRRGALSGSVVVRGKQGHVAYPDSCRNAIHTASDIIQALTSHRWSTGSGDFPGTSLQITHVDTGAWVDNLVPGAARIAFNVRYDAEYSNDSLVALLTSLIKNISPHTQIHWSRPCSPYLTKSRANDCWLQRCERAIVNTTGKYPLLSTAGGTSDGRFFDSSTQIIEVGVPNSTIHQANECVHLCDIITLEDIYTDILQGLV